MGTSTPARRQPLGHIRVPSFRAQTGAQVRWVGRRRQPWLQRRGGPPTAPHPHPPGHRRYFHSQQFPFQRGTWEKQSLSQMQTAKESGFSAPSKSQAAGRGAAFRHRERSVWTESHSSVFWVGTDRVLLRPGRRLGSSPGRRPATCTCPQEWSGAPQALEHGQDAAPRPQPSALTTGSGGVSRSPLLLALITQGEHTHIPAPLWFQQPTRPGQVSLPSHSDSGQSALSPSIKRRSIPVLLGGFHAPAAPGMLSGGLHTGFSELFSSSR